MERDLIVVEIGEDFEYAYFPLSAMISLVITMKDGATTETSIVGYEGMIGLPIILGGNHSFTQGVVQIPGTALKLKASILKQAFQQKESLQRILLLYAQARLTQVAQLSACNRQHTILERLARWLLTVQDWRPSR